MQTQVENRNLQVDQSQHRTSAHGNTLIAPPRTEHMNGPKQSNPMLINEWQKKDK